MMQGIGDQLLGVEGQEIAGWSQHGVGDARSNVGEQIYDIHELIEKLAMVGLDCNKWMPRDIEWSKKFPTQVEKVGKIEWSGGANGDVDSDVVTNPDADCYWMSNINGPYRFYWRKNIHGCRYSSNKGPILIKIRVQYQWISS